MLVLLIPPLSRSPDSDLEFLFSIPNSTSVVLIFELIFLPTTPLSLIFAMFTFGLADCRELKGLLFSYSESLYSLDLSSVELV